MPRLTLVNGPPGIGKSTLAQLYVDRHPGVLDLDIDQVARLIGGFRADFGGTVTMARTIALEMAKTHLLAGHDVIVPQFVGRVSELERFERSARDADALFCHVVLMDTLESCLRRFESRGATNGNADIARMYEALGDVVRARLTSVLVTSEDGAIDHTYDLLAAALEPDTLPAPPRGVAVVIDSGRVLVIKRRRKGIEYAVLPGGGVETGESSADAAGRELHEETSLTGRVERELWERVDDGRQATYFLMTDVSGSPVLSGEEALEHCPDNSFVLSWVTADELDHIRLQPAQIREPLASLLRGVGQD